MTLGVVTDMDLALNKLNALRIMRSIRRGEIAADLERRSNLRAPSPSPAKRWTRGALELAPVAPSGVTSHHHLDVAVPSRSSRLRMHGLSNTVYTRGLPENSWIDLGGGIQIPCPELLFVELAETMEVPALLMLGLELCGRFARDPHDPRDGESRLDVEPVTTASAIRAYARECTCLRGLGVARRIAELLVDDAWSPMEAVMATVMLLPFDAFGYGMRGVVLNQRVEASDRLLPYSEKTSRVPDILLAGTRVGINYDGGMHLRLQDIADAAARAERGEDGASKCLEQAISSVRAKYVDDRRRDRDLLLQGYRVLPATSEDLYQEGALDKLMGQLVELAEQEPGVDLSAQRAFLGRKRFAAERQRMVWSLLPGGRGARIARELSEAPEESGYVADETIRL